jgi:LysR family transcriptional regulator, transcriptional activator of nhaA
MDWLNYHHLFHSWTVAKEAGLRRAAERLLVSEPWISTQIRQLEESLGAELFMCQSRSRVLTDTGCFSKWSMPRPSFSSAPNVWAVKQQRTSTARALRLTVGMEDSFPKMQSYEIFKPRKRVP